MASQRLAADDGKAFIFLIIPAGSCRRGSRPMRGGAAARYVGVFVDSVVRCGPAALAVTEEIAV